MPLVIKVNNKQSRHGSNSDGIFAKKVTIIALTAAQITANSVDCGIERIPGCYIDQAFIEINGIPVHGGIVTVRPDSNSTTCVVRCANYSHTCEVDDTLIINTYWKKGNNPQGIVTTPDLSVEEDA